MNKKYDLCIIGAGAAGLMAAITASQSGAKTALFEKNTTAGRKLLITGGSRCNVTHRASPRDFANVCSPFDRFLRHSIYDFSPENMIEFLSQLGIDTITEPDGSVFPKSQKALDIKQALCSKAAEEGTHFFYDKAVTELIKTDSTFIVKHNAGQIEAEKVIIATGGLSYPKTGCIGDGYKFAEQLGHTIKKPQSCLAPLVTKEYWVGRLAGVGISKASLLIDGDKKKNQLTGPLIFTSDGIGGPAVLNFSRQILPRLNSGSVSITVDLMPDIQEDKIASWLNTLCEDNPKKELTNLLSEKLPRSITSEISKLADIKPSIKAASLSKKARLELTKKIKKLPLTVTALKPVENATVTRGGVCIEQINPKTMESEKCPGLFFAGEVMNIDGPCGGYNLQIAFSTSVLAAKSAIRRQ